MFSFDSTYVIAAVRCQKDFDAAVMSNVKVIFILDSSISLLKKYARDAHENGKTVFLHVDLAEGLGKDAAGISYASSCGIDGIISTRTSLIRAAKECGILCIQRFFMVDSQSALTAVESLKQSKADMIEIMPGIAYKAISRFVSQTDTPVIAGGLIDDKSEVEKALASGASAVSTGKQMLWNI